MMYSDSEEASGAEIVFADVARALAGIPEVILTVVVAQKNTLLQTLLTDGGFPKPVLVRAHPSWIVPLGVWDPTRGIVVRRIVARYRPEALVVNLPGVEFGAAPLVWTDRSAMATLAIVHLHHRISSGTIDRPLAGLRDRIIAPVLRRLDHAWVISPDAVGAMASDWGLGPERCSVLPLQARTPERADRLTARRRLGLPSEGTVIGIVGRVNIAQKGHDTFVAAAALLAATRDDFVFAVVGDGPDTERVRHLVAAAGLGARFHFLGVLRPPDAAYSALDAIALPSRFEGLPLVALEALAAGLVGVASGVDGLSAVWPGEWTVEPDRPDALAARLAALLKLSAECRAAMAADAWATAGRVLTNDLAGELVPVISAAVQRRSALRQLRRAATK